MVRALTALLVVVLLTSCSTYDTYRWDKGGAPISMLSVADGICALKKIAGRFDGTGDWVEVTAINGVWTLRGSASHAGTMAEAHCVSRGNFRFAQQLSYGNQTTAAWSQTPTGYQVVQITPNSASNCWLMGIGGDLSTRGGLVNIDTPQPPAQVLNFHQFAPVRPLYGASVCLDATPGPKITSAGWGGVTPADTQLKPLPGTADAFCYLRYLSGKFTGTTPDRMTYAGISSADWDARRGVWKGQYLSAGNLHSEPGSLSVGVSCIYFDR